MTRKRAMSAAASPEQIFVVWTAFARRVDSMQSYFGYDIVYLSFAFSKRLLRPLEYIVKLVSTLVQLTRRRPRLIWVQLPPPPALYACCLYRVLFSRNVRILADCHNGAFDRVWFAFPGVRALLNRCDAVVVHNHAVRERALRAGITSDRVVVLEDLPADICYTPGPSVPFSRPWLLMPCGFASDEPIAAVAEAARALPEITFVLTGNATRARGVHDLRNMPANLVLTGFLPLDAFDRLVCASDGLIGLTTARDIQLSVASEAVGAGKPLVLSDTPLLRELFPSGAVYVDPLVPASIAAGCLQVLAEGPGLARQMRALALSRRDRWKAQALRLATVARIGLRKQGVDAAGASGAGTPLQPRCPSEEACYGALEERVVSADSEM